MINEKMRRLGAHRSVIRELFEYGKKRKSEIGESNVFDFSIGNPSAPVPCEVTKEIINLVNESEPTLLHGYTSAQGDYSVRGAISAELNERYSLDTTPECFYMTVGAAGALTSTLCGLVTEGEEVILIAPYFPEYKVFIERAGGTVRVAMADTVSFQPDVSEIEKLVNEKTAAIIVNSPNNPTGAVYTEESIERLSNMLKKKEIELSKTIYLISDEPYRELVYGTATVPFITKYYDDTVITYSYSKSLSLPGERIGYVLVNPAINDFTAVYDAIAGSARSLGYVCAPSLLQRLVARVTGMHSALDVYDENRTLLYNALTEYGFTALKPDGAFYLFLKSPISDAYEFCNEAKREELLLVPSNDFGIEGYVRISYCVIKEVIETALPAFKRLSQKYGL